MGIVKIFYKDDCPRCPDAKRLRDRLASENVNVLDFNVGTAKGLAEAAYYRVMAVPTVVVEDEQENGLGEWRGNVPELDEVLDAVRSS